MRKFKLQPIEVHAAQWQVDIDDTHPMVFIENGAAYVETELDGRVYLQTGDWILFNSRGRTNVAPDNAFKFFFEEIK
jgi:hypothetical protein